MKTLPIPLLLILVLLAGCNSIEGPEDEPYVYYTGSNGELTDGFCLRSNSQVVLNHHDIEYYDYGTHLVYLKDHMSGEKLLAGSRTFRVYAGGEEVYRATTQSGHSSFISPGPVIWTTPLFYPTNVIAIDLVDSYEVMLGSAEDPRDGWELDWMSVLEGGGSTTITLEYDDFLWVPQGSYQVAFEFPGLQYQVDRDELVQDNGRIWLGKLRLHGEVVVE